MIISNSLDLKKQLNKKTAVALGSFDALHIGHTEVIKAAVNYAHANNLLSLVQIFDASFFKEPINTLQERLEIIKNIGADIVVVEKFDEDFKSLSYQDFVKEYLTGRYNAKIVFSGENYRFGHLAKGDVHTLNEECKKYNINANVIKCIELDGIISSSKIREFLKKGDVESAHKYMSRPYSVSGTVIHGSAIGQKIGFPTANISYPQNILMPKDGVYLTRVNVDSSSYFGITNIGTKPTVNEQSRNIETYISDFDGNLYEKNIRIEFLKRIRDTKHFDTLAELKNQLSLDKKQIEKQKD